jgi:hypothetical protein
VIKTSAHPYWNSIRVRPDQQREINEKLISLRNAAQKLDRNQSGFPPGFREFCLKHLGGMVRDNEYYRAQVLSMIGKLQESMAKVQLEREQLDKAFDVRLESMAEELEELVAVLPVEVEAKP